MRPTRLPSAAPQPDEARTSEQACEQHILFDGTRITIRPVREGDRALVGAFVAGLSEEARYYRFKKQFPQPTDRLLSFLTQVDQRTHIALVCTVSTDSKEQEIAEARFVAYPDGKTCEFAIAVADAWQGSGVAGRLMTALEGAARARGLTTMEGFVLSTNRKMLRFVQARGFSIHSDPTDLKSVRVVKTL